MRSLNLNALGGAFLLPPLFIWLAVLLRAANTVLGEALAAWLGGSLPEIAVVLVWVGFPAAAMIFGLGAYAKGENRVLSVGVVALSSLLLLMIFFGAMLRQS